MASVQEILSTLSDTEKENYKDVIALSKKELIDKKLLYTKIHSFVQKRYNRLSDLNARIVDTEEIGNVEQKHGIFQSTVRSIMNRGQQELDKTNGIILRTVYEDSKKASMRARQLKDMTLKVSLLSTFLEQLNTFKTDLENIETILNSS